jgi:hypothetical protein
LRGSAFAEATADVAEAKARNCRCFDPVRGTARFDRILATAKAQ